MANKKNVLEMLIVVLAFGITVVGSIGCSADGGGGGGPPPGGPPPEQLPVKDRWGKWVDVDSTATLDYSVTNDGVCTITVGGKAEPHKVDEWFRWKVDAQYSYTAKAGKSYAYTFEAWTQSGTRTIHVQYYGDYYESVYIGSDVSLTTERKEYTVWGEALPKGGIRAIQFQCADKLGTYYVKMLEIKEYTIGKLTITNFSGSPGLTQNNWLFGNAYTNGDKTLEFNGGIVSDGSYSVQIKGNTISMQVWIRSWNDDDSTITPFAGNTTITKGDLTLSQYSEGNLIEDKDEFGNTIWLIIPDNYINKVPIIFTKGNATINFKNQMEMVAGEP